MPSDYSILKRSGFDLEIAVFLAEACQAAYHFGPEWTQQAGFGTAHFFDRGNVQGFWCETDRVALLAFRGTSNPGQWLRDIRFFPWPHPWGFVHRGFLDGVQDVEIDLRSFDQAARGAHHVWFTGHSLGGALALIAAARAKVARMSPSLYTYGQPRVGLGDFADRFAIELAGKLVRFVNQSDIVTRVPPGLLYRHTGLVKRIVRPGVLEVVPSLEIPLPTDPRLRSQLEAAGRAATIPAMESAAAAEAAGITAPMLIDNDLAPLSDKEFAELQLALGSAAGVPVLEGPALEGVLPWIGDHAISEYIRLLREIRDQG